jgi:hypothetical protein
MSDTPQVDAFLRAKNCTPHNPAAFEWAIGLARSLERELAAHKRDGWKMVRELERQNAELDAQLMRWFKAASPYATPGSLEEGLKKLQGECSECRRLNNRLAKIDKTLDNLGAPKHEQVEGLTMELSRVGRIKRLTCLCLSFPHACPVHRQNSHGHPYCSTCKGPADAQD